MNVLLEQSMNIIFQTKQQAFYLHAILLVKHALKIIRVIIQIVIDVMKDFH